MSDKKYVLVEAVQQHRMRYVVELQNDEPAEWALDDVTMGKAVEFSQQNLGETIISHRVLADGLPEALAMAREDNKGVADGWSDALVFQNHITPARGNDDVNMRKDPAETAAYTGIMSPDSGQG